MKVDKIKEFIFVSRMGRIMAKELFSTLETVKLSVLFCGMFSTGCLLREGDKKLFSQLIPFKNCFCFSRRILTEGKSYEDLTEVAKLFNIHETEKEEAK